MNKDLEFHYVVSYREGYGWQTCPDVEEACLPDGTIYDVTHSEWFTAYEDSDDPENSSIAGLDTDHYRMLHSALRLLNEGAINA